MYLIGTHPQSILYIRYFHQSLMAALPWLLREHTACACFNFISCGNVTFVSRVLLARSSIWLFAHALHSRLTHISTSCHLIGQCMITDFQVVDFSNFAMMPNKFCFSRSFNKPFHHRFPCTLCWMARARHQLPNHPWKLTSAQMESLLDRFQVW